MPYVTDQKPTTREPGQTPYQRPPGDGRATTTAAGEELTTVRTATAGTSVEVLAGATAIVLSIIGLAGYLPIPMAAIATIAIGVGLFAEGGTIAARWNDVINRLGERRTDIESG